VNENGNPILLLRRKPSSQTFRSSKNHILSASFQLPLVFFQTIFYSFLSLHLSLFDFHFLSPSNNKNKARQDKMYERFPTPEDLWNDFIDCSDMKEVFRYYQNACEVLPGQSNKKKGIFSFRRSSALPAKKCWHRALRRACELWSLIQQCIDHGDEEGQLGYWHNNSHHCGIMIMGPSYVDLVKEPLWNTLCFLMKGVYHIANGLSLHRLQYEPNHKSLLHAAIGSLPYCHWKEKNTFDFIARSHTKAVFDRVLQLHGDQQVTQTGPFNDQIPVHVAASNPGAFRRTIKRLKSGIVIEQRGTLVDYMLNRVFESTPQSALATLDVTQHNPLEVACMNGHSPKQIGMLQILPTQESCKLAILVAIGTTCVSDASERPPSLRDWLRSAVKKNNGNSSCKSGKYNDGEYRETIQGQRQALSIIYGCIRADVDRLSHCLRENDA